MKESEPVQASKINGPNRPWHQSAETNEKPNPKAYIFGASICTNERHGNTRVHKDILESDRKTERWDGFAESCQICNSHHMNTCLRMHRQNRTDCLGGFSERCRWRMMISSRHSGPEWIVRMYMGGCFHGVQMCTAFLSRSKSNLVNCRHLNLEQQFEFGLETTIGSRELTLGMLFY